MTRTAVACFLLLLVTESYAQRNDWVLTFNRSTRGSDMTLLKLQNDSLLVSKKGTLYAIPVSRITKLEYSDGNSNTLRNMIIGTVVGGAVGFFAGNIIDNQNNSNYNPYWSAAQPTDNNYRWLLAGGGAVAGCIIGDIGTPGNTISHDIGNMDVKEKLAVLSSILVSEGKRVQMPTVWQPKNSIHLKNRKVLIGIITDCIPDSMMEIQTSDSSLFVTPMKAIDSVDANSEIFHVPDNALFLKNGSIIKCSIVTLIPDSSITIRTADSSFFTFRMTDVDRVGIDYAVTVASPTQPKQTPVQTDSLSKGQHRERNITLGIFAGLNIPIGDFASSGADGGAATTEFGMGIDVTVGKQTVGWYSSATFTINSVDKSSLGIPTDLITYLGNWEAFWLMTGMRVSGRTSPQAQVYGYGQIGVMFGKAPDITLSGPGGTGSQTATGASAFAFGLGGGVILSDQFNIGLRLCQSNPEYTYTIIAGSTKETGTGSQSTTCLLFTVGINF